MNLSESYKNRLSELSGLKSNSNYEIVYRGQPTENQSDSPRNSIWVTPNMDFAKEYGSIKKYKMPKSLNIINTDYYDVWEELIDNFSSEGDYDEYKYQPSDEFIAFLTSKGYEGFENGDNILIFDKSKLLK